MIDIRVVGVSEVLSLRQKVLRPYWKPEQCQNPQDTEPLSFHLAGFLKGQIVSVGSFHRQPCELVSAEWPFRLRGMATDASFQGRGFGAELLRKGTSILTEMSCDLIWANARIKAFAFYRKEGFLEAGEIFEMPEIGAHKVMYKHLNPR